MSKLLIIPEIANSTSEIDSQGLQSAHAVPKPRSEAGNVLSGLENPWLGTKSLVPGPQWTQNAPKLPPENRVIRDPPLWGALGALDPCS